MSRTRSTSRGRYSLTAEHHAQLGPWSERWIEIALRTRPQDDEDRAATRDAVLGLYAAAKIDPPSRVVFCPSPISAAIASVAAACTLEFRRREIGTEAERMAALRVAVAEAVRSGIATLHGVPSPRSTPAVTATFAAIHDATVEAARVANATLAATYGATLAATDDATRSAALFATSSAGRAATYAATVDATDDATHAATYDATYTATVDAIDDAIRDATRDATDDAIDDATDAATYAATYAATDDGSAAAIRGATRAATHEATLAATRAAIDVATRWTTDGAIRIAIDAATHSATHAATHSATLVATRAATRDATDDAIDDATYNATFAATVEATAETTDAATRAATRAATYAATFAATAEATAETTRIATRDATDEAIDDATDAATRAATYDATAVIFAATAEATAETTRIATRDATDEATLAATGITTALAAAMLEAMPRWGTMRNGGNQWAGWCAFLSFFRHVVGLDLPEYDRWRHYEDAAIHAGPRFMHREFCIVSDFPTRIMRDADNRPHCEDGPALAWSDGWAVWYWHGLRVPARVIEQPETITVAEIDGESNAEIRRVLVARYGEARYLLDSGATIVDESQWGTLYRRDLPGDEPLVMVRVMNSTPEPDGSIKPYFLRVHHECRPILQNGFGPAQALTARNAVASTFGLTGEEYAPEVQT